MSENLIQALIREMSRAREVLKLYEEIPQGAGAFGAAMIKMEIKNAEEALATNDVVKIIAAYTALKEIE